jgi:mannose-6-phosphate isomerase-like protein (cupin superfamily)
MLGLAIPPFSIDATCASDRRAALRALAAAAQSYLQQFDEATGRGLLPARTALVTRVRGTGPGVSFGSVVAAVEAGFSLQWTCPFEGSINVSGAALPIGAALGESRDDGFLFLRFAPGTVDLPLHIHPESDRFIFVIGGRGFFHVTDEPLDAAPSSEVCHSPARDRDALMFRRGVVHTFSTAEHPLSLLSYHRPFVPLDEPNQYTVSVPPVTPAQFLSSCTSRVSFDAAWTRIAMSQPSPAGGASRSSVFALH